MTRAAAGEKNYAAWSHGNVLQFYTGQRHTVDELYESERAVLMPAIASCASVLDVGCAAGGFYDILQALKPGIAYAGVDVVPEMIAAARARHPSVRFEVSDGATLDFTQKAFDLAFCTGVLLHNPNYEGMLRELYRVASRSCIIDLPRLVAAPYTFRLETSHMVLKRRFHDVAVGVDEQQTSVPYVLAQPQPMFEFLVEALDPKPRALVAVGYYGHPNESVVLPVKPVCFCVVYLAKGDRRTTRTKVLLDLPDDIAAQIRLRDVEYVQGGKAAIAGLIRNV